MPTHDEEPRFLQDYARLSAKDRLLFAVAYKKMVADLGAKRPLRKGLRIKGVQGHTGVYELTWSGDGRATFEYGPEVRPGEAHIIWRRIGTHDIFQNP